MEPIHYTKRIGYLFERVRDLDNIKTAIRRAAKRKSKRRSVQRILEDVDGYALKIQKMLDDETFIPSPYTIRGINDGIVRKKRVIAVPRFYPDQCIHHAYIQVFSEVVMHGAYPHSCGCVPGKGTDGAKKAIEKWIRTDPKGTSKVLKLDIKKCYPTMSHEKLREKLQKRIKDQKFLRLSYRLIASFQQPMATGGEMLPESIAVGLPVGLYTSPWFCNFFFQDLDHKIAEESGVKHYTRYVDDMVLFDNSKRRLHSALRMIEEEAGKLLMKVKENWQVFHLNIRPLDFLGFKFHKGWSAARRPAFLGCVRADTAPELSCVSDNDRLTLFCVSVVYAVLAPFRIHSGHICGLVVTHALRRDHIEASRLQGFCFSAHITCPPVRLIHPGLHRPDPDLLSRFPV